jgi:hypothetical protein
VKTLLCPHRRTCVLENASVCAGCGADILHGLSRGQRSVVGFAFVGAAILIFAIFMHAYEIAYGHSFLRFPKAEDGLLAIAGLTCVVFLPYLIGTKIARLFFRSRVRFYRTYQHQ